MVKIKPNIQGKSASIPKLKLQEEQRPMIQTKEVSLMEDVSKSEDRVQAQENEFWDELKPGEVDRTP